MGQAKRLNSKQGAIEAGVKRMPREQQVFLYVLCCLEDMAKAEGQKGTGKVSPEGREAFQCMVAQDFKPTELEVDRAIQFMVKKGLIDLGVPSDAEVAERAAVMKKIKTIH